MSEDYVETIKELRKFWESLSEIYENEESRLAGVTYREMKEHIMILRTIEEDMESIEHTVETLLTGLSVYA